MSKSSKKIPPLDRAYFKRLGRASIEAHETRSKHRTATETWKQCEQLNKMVKAPPENDMDWIIGHLRYRQKSQERFAHEHAR